MIPDRDPDAVLEDLQFLAETGVGTVEAARRTGFPSANALEKWLAPDRYNRMDVWHALRRHDWCPVNDAGAARWGRNRRFRSSAA